MCGRFLLDADYEALIERYKIFEDINNRYDRRIQIFPGDEIWTVQLKQGIRHIAQNRWGIELSKGKLVFNARSETFLNKGLFSQMKPCIIPATGYYEWHKNTHSKYQIEPPEKSLISIAGLYDEKRAISVILTQNASPTLVDLHDRMPVILNKDQEEKWLLQKKIDFTRASKNTSSFEKIRLDDFEQLTIFDL